MKRYILYGFVSLLFFITVDKIIGYISYKKLTASNVYFYGEINNAIADTSKVFILGSSRAECHYDSQELKSLFGKSVYNAGTGGYGIFYSYAILKERIARNIPEIVILDVEPTILNDAKQFGILTKLNAMTDFILHSMKLLRLIRIISHISCS